MCQALQTQRMAHTDTTTPLRSRGPVDELDSRADLCRRLGISRSTSYRYERTGYLPRPIRLGPGVLRWRRADIDALIARLAEDRS